MGEYNLAILVEEWRDGVLVGTVLRDMQITVANCNNQPPELEAIRDTCVEAGDQLSFQIFADDPDLNSNGTRRDNVTITGFGDPFEVASSPADPIVQGGLLPPVVATFNWQTDCSHVRVAPYQAVIQAEDNGAGVALVDIETVNIVVVAPAPENLSAEAVGSAIELDWETSPCTEAIGYKVFRRIDPFGFIPSQCETGVPAYTGYQQIANLSGLETTFYADEDEAIFGRQNCYMVVACFADGAQSYASNEACAEIKFEVPIIKKNSIGTTAQAGVDTVYWRSPIELDSIAFPGPYQYRLFRSEGYGEVNEQVFQSPTSPDLDALPTEYISNNGLELNTADTAHTYRVELFSNGELAARSNLASSLFLVLIPDDNQIEVTWREEVPWINFEYDVYRQTDGVGEFEFLATTTGVDYLDTGLLNNRNYCYYIVSRGSYFAIEENDTLINFSQRVCSSPYDRTPPCVPELAADGDCVSFEVFLDWTNPNETCPETDDVTAYNVYFKPTEDAEFELIDELQGATITDLDLFFENSIAGCYAVSALDSLAPWPNGELVQNESELSNVVCLDNCPEYTLPNVFTPNADGRNDVFGPLKFRSIESVDFTVFNRWGGVVFQSTTPELGWRGENEKTGEIVSDGVYYYTCRVFSIRLSGLDAIDLAGYVTVFGEPGNNTNR